MDLTDNSGRGFVSVISSLGQTQYFDAYAFLSKSPKIVSVVVGKSLFYSGGSVTVRKYSSESHVKDTYRLARQHGWDVIRTKPEGTRAEQVRTSTREYIVKQKHTFRQFNAGFTDLKVKMPYNSPHDFTKLQTRNLVGLNQVLYEASQSHAQKLISRKKYVYDLMECIFSWPGSAQSFRELFEQQAGARTPQLDELVHEAQQAHELEAFNALHDTSKKISYVINRHLDKTKYATPDGPDERVIGLAYQQAEFARQKDNNS